MVLSLLLQSVLPTALKLGKARLDRQLISLLQDTRWRTDVRW